MYEINKRDVISVTDMLLFNISEELKRINGTTIKEENNEPKPCKYCGGTHENKGQIMACARKHKKKDGV